MGIAADDADRKEILAVIYGCRESPANWYEVLIQLSSHGLKPPPKLAIGGGALGFWNALAKHWPTTKQQHCWLQKTASVLNKIPKAVQPKMKEKPQDIWMAETRENAYKAFTNCVGRFELKFPAAM